MDKFNFSAKVNWTKMSLEEQFDIIQYVEGLSLKSSIDYKIDYCSGESYIKYLFKDEKIATLATLYFSQYNL